MGPTAEQESPKGALTALLHSLAHDLAQPLTTVHCFLELAGQRKPNVSPGTAELRNTALQIDRAIAISKGISALTREPPAASTPSLPLDALLEEVFEIFGVLVHTGFLTFERLDTGGVQIRSNAALRQSLIVVITRLAGQSITPIKITVAADVAEDRCFLDLSWRINDTLRVPVQSAEGIFAGDQSHLRELLQEAGADLVECGNVPALSISAPVAAEAPSTPR
jgi:signal transduction histidine kinase